MAIEQRYSQVRAADNGEFKIAGYAARYNTVAHLLDFDETIEPGAFENSVRSMDDVKCLLNHDASIVLGRVGNGTLQLEADSIGLRFVCQLDQQNQQHRNIYASIKRGDIDECSFAFTVPAGGQRFENRNGDVPLRTLSKVNLLDVSAVTYPAYKEGTSVAARTYFDAEARSALSAAIGRPLKNPVALVDLDVVRRMVGQWTDAENRRKCEEIGKQLKAEAWKRHCAIDEDLINIQRAADLATVIQTDFDRFLISDLSEATSKLANFPPNYFLE